MKSQDSAPLKVDGSPRSEKLPRAEPGQILVLLVAASLQVSGISAHKEPAGDRKRDLES